MNSKSDTEGLGGTSLEDFADLLLQRRRVLSKDVQGLEDGACAERTEAFGDVASLHPAEQATDNSEQALSLGRMESQCREIRDIDEALERVRDGAFGLCEECRRPIPAERLRAIPYARRCMACQLSEEGTSP